MGSLTHPQTSAMEVYKYAIGDVSADGEYGQSGRDCDYHMQEKTSHLILLGIKTTGYSQGI